MTAKGAKGRKLLPISSLEKKLDRVFSEYIRRRDCDEGGTTQCVTCGKYEYWKDLDAGHFVKRQHRAVRWDERNVHPQCTRCNHFMSGRQDDMALYIVRLYGKETLQQLMQLKYTTKKFVRTELDDLIKHYQEKLENLNVGRG